MLTIVIRQRARVPCDIGNPVFWMIIHDPQMPRLALLPNHTSPHAEGRFPVKSGCSMESVRTPARQPPGSGRAGGIQGLGEILRRHADQTSCFSTNVALQWRFRRNRVKSVSWQSVRDSAATALPGATASRRGRACGRTRPGTGSGSPARAARLLP